MHWIPSLEDFLVGYLQRSRESKSFRIVLFEVAIGRALISRP